MTRVGKKGAGVLITGHRITVALLSIGYKFIECLKVGPSKIGGRVAILNSETLHIMGII